MFRKHFQKQLLYCYRLSFSVDYIGFALIAGGVGIGVLATAVGALRVKWNRDQAMFQSEAGVDSEDDLEIIRD